jgi:two-component system LytT family response regulator
MIDDKITCVIIDDELQARKLLKKYIDQSDELVLVGEFANVTTALKGIPELEPDVIFLDVQMPGKTGIEMLTLLEIPEKYMIVFTTAYDQYAIQAFDNSAVDYLLKPFDQERFSLTIEKLLRARQALKAEASDELDKISKLLMQVQLQSRIEGSYLEKVTCKVGGKLRIVFLKDVYYIEADGNYTQAHTQEQGFLLDITISEIAVKLNPAYFVRIHRSTIVNTSFITAIEPHFNGEYKIELRNGTILKVSRSYKIDFNRAMGVF